MGLLGKEKKQCQMQGSTDVVAVELSVLEENDTNL